MTKLANKLKDFLGKISQEELNKYFPKNTIPKGWVSINEHLPMLLAKDITSGGSSYKVLYKDGTEGLTTVSDHNTWYYFAKEMGITHWYNE